MGHNFADTACLKPRIGRHVATSTVNISIIDLTTELVVGTRNEQLVITGWCVSKHDRRMTLMHNYKEIKR